MSEMYNEACLVGAKVQLEEIRRRSKQNLKLSVSAIGIALASAAIASISDNIVVNMGCAGGCLVAGAVLLGTYLSNRKQMRKLKKLSESLDVY